MVGRVSPQLRPASAAYRNGINAYIDHLATRPDLVPGEFAALGVPLTDLAVRDSAAHRDPARPHRPSGDGNELANAKALQAIGAAGASTGSRRCARPDAIATIKRSEGVFPAPARAAAGATSAAACSRSALPADDRRAGAEGPGTITVGGDPARCAPSRARRPAPTSPASCPEAARSCGRSPIRSATAATSSTARSSASRSPSCSSSSSCTPPSRTSAGSARPASPWSGSATTARSPGASPPASPTRTTCSRSS